MHNIVCCNDVKQHCVTSTAAHCFEKQNLMMHISMSHKTAFLVKAGHVLQRFGFPSDVL